MARVLTNPAPGRTLTSPYGPRTGGFHDGIDFAGDNFPVVAAAAGEVVAVGGQYSPYTASGFGYTGAGVFVLIRHDQYGFRTGYAHMRDGSRTVEIGDRVTAGQVVGRSGNTGNSYGAHLHFDLWTGLSGYTRTDPEPYIDWTLNPNPEEDDVALTTAQAEALDWLYSRRAVIDSMDSKVTQLWDRRGNFDLIDDTKVKVDSTAVTVNSIKAKVDTL